MPGTSDATPVPGLQAAALTAAATAAATAQALPAVPVGDDGADWRVNEAVPQPWPAHAKDALARWRQGHLVRRPGIVWLGPAGPDCITGDVDGGDWDYAPVAGPDLVAPYGVIASQTCDVVAAGPGARHPFVDVHPVFDMSELDASRRRQVERHDIRYLVALTEPPEADGFWVADLRMTMTVSKAVLVEQAPIEGFRTEVDVLAFAEVMAVKRRRPALHDVLSESVPKILGDHIRSKDRSGTAPDWHENVEQVRLAVTGHRLGPDTVSLVVVAVDGDLPVEQRALWREAHGAVAGVLKKAGMSLGATVFTNPDAMSARQYRQTTPVPLPQLRGGPWW